MKRKISALFGLTFFIFFLLSACSREFNSGLLWEVKAPTGEKSYVFGTLHLVNSRMDCIAEMIQTYEQNARIVLLEYPVKAPNTRNLSMASHTHFIRNELSTDEYSSLEKIIAEKKIPLSIIENSSLLTIYTLMINPNIAVKPPMDYQFMDFARQNEILLKSLESIKDRNNDKAVLGNTFFIELIKEAIHNPEYIERAIAIMEENYLKEDLKYLQTSIRESKIDENLLEQFMDVMVIKRNERMVKNALPELDKGKVFMAIGAGHLAGEKGVLNLLKKEGYELTRVPISKLNAGFEACRHHDF